MDVEYLDYYMADCCRTIMAIDDTPLKLYKLVVPDNTEDDGEYETPVPIPADVSLYYLFTKDGKKQGRSSRSNYLKEYRALLKSISDQE